MGVMPIRRLLLTMSGPMMVSMLIQALYNVVDSMFVSYISEGALTAVSLAYPMQNLMIAVATGTGVGVNALLSRNLGEKNFEMANRAAGNAIFLGVVSFAVFALVGAVGSRLYFTVQVDDPEIIAYGVDYLSVIMVLSVGCFGQVLLSRLLQSTGKTFYSMVIQLVGAGLNIVLDPIMIFGLLGCPAMGVAGAALATVISQVAGTILGLYYNLRKNPEIRFAWTYLRPSKPVIARIYGVGIPSILLQTVSSLLIFGLNQILVVFSETATAVYGVYFKLQGFAFLPIIGMNNGMVPIIAYNYGARKPDRIMETIKLAIRYATLIMVVAVVLFQIFPAQLLGIFQASPEMLTIGVPALRILSLCVSHWRVHHRGLFGVSGFGERASQHVHLGVPAADPGPSAGLCPVFDWGTEHGLVVLSHCGGPGRAAGAVLPPAGPSPGDSAPGRPGLSLLTHPCRENCMY